MPKAVKGARFYCKDCVFWGQRERVQETGTLREFNLHKYNEPACFLNTEPVYRHGEWPACQSFAEEWTE